MNARTIRHLKSCWPKVEARGGYFAVALQGWPADEAAVPWLLVDDDAPVDRARILELDKEVDVRGKLILGRVTVEDRVAFDISVESPTRSPALLRRALRRLSELEALETLRLERVDRARFRLDDDRKPASEANEFDELVALLKRWQTTFGNRLDASNLGKATEVLGAIAERCREFARGERLRREVEALKAQVAAARRAIAAVDDEAPLVEAGRTFGAEVLSETIRFTRESPDLDPEDDDEPGVSEARERYDGLAIVVREKYYDALEQVALRVAQRIPGDQGADDVLRHLKVLAPAIPTESGELPEVPTIEAAIEYCVREDGGIRRSWAVVLTRRGVVTLDRAIPAHTSTHATRQALYELALRLLGEDGWLDLPGLLAAFSEQEGLPATGDLVEDGEPDEVEQDEEALASGRRLREEAQRTRDGDLAESARALLDTSTLTLRPLRDAFVAMIEALLADPSRVPRSIRGRIARAARSGDAIYAVAADLLVLRWMPPPLADGEPVGTTAGVLGALLRSVADGRVPSDGLGVFGPSVADAIPRFRAFVDAIVALDRGPLTAA